VSDVSTVFVRPVCMGDWVVGMVQRGAGVYYNCDLVRVQTAEARTKNKRPKKP
jgi:hypothetical protein